MVESEYSPDNYNNLKISIETIKKPQMLKFIPDHPKTKKMCENAVTKLPFLIMYVPDWYMVREMCSSYSRKWWNAKVYSWLLQKSKICVITPLIIMLMN